MTPTQPQEPHWKKFEGEVAGVYQELGYRVQRNCEQFGQEIDILAERDLPGGVSIRLIVEVKAKDNGPSNQDVFNFAAYLTTMRHKGITNGVIVTERPAGKAAQEAAESNGVRILTAEQLRRSIIDFGPYLRHQSRRIGEDEVQRQYIPLRLLLHSESLSNNKRLPIEPSVDDLRAHVDAWLQTQERLLPIFGDYGSGKTTFMRFLFRSYAEKCIATNFASRVPLLVTLNEAKHPFRIDQLLTQHLETHVGIRVPYAAIEELNATQRLLILLDGFDELINESTREVRQSHFAEVARILDFGSKIILTSRPTYFAHRDEIEKVIGNLSSQTRRTPTAGSQREAVMSERFMTVSRLKSLLSAVGIPSTSARPNPASIATPAILALFSDDDIRKYVLNLDEKLRREGLGTSSELLARIKLTYNLQDLARRPILLAMIVETVPSLPKDQSIDLSVIYEVYTDRWLERDIHRGRTLITGERRRLFMEELALQMAHDRIESIHYKGLSERIRRAFDIRDDSYFENLATDIRTCTFLRRQTNDEYVFIHRSFQEYFVALSVYNDILEGNWKKLRLLPLRSEVLLFLACFILRLKHEADEIRRRLNEMPSPLGDEDSIELSNLLTVSAYLGQHLSGYRFVKLATRAASIESNIVGGSTLVMSDVQFIQATMHETRVKNVEMQSIGFVECLLDHWRIEGGRFLTQNYSRCRIDGGIAQNARFDRTTFAQTKFSTIKFENVTFKDCVFVGCRFDAMDFSTVNFTACLFICCAFNGATGTPLVDRSVAVSCRGVRSDSIREVIRGVLDVDSPDLTVDARSKLERLRNRIETIQKTLNEEDNRLRKSIEEQSKQVEAIERENNAFPTQQSQMERQRHDLRRQRKEFKLREEQLTTKLLAAEEDEAGCRRQRHSLAQRLELSRGSMRKMLTEELEELDRRLLPSKVSLVAECRAKRKEAADAVRENAVAERNLEGRLEALRERCNQTGDRVQALRKNIATQQADLEMPPSNRRRTALEPHVNHPRRGLDTDDVLVACAATGAIELLEGSAWEKIQRDPKECLSTIWDDVLAARYVERWYGSA